MNGIKNEYNPEPDKMRMHNYLDQKVMCDMSIQEQKALCRLILYILAKDSAST